MDNQMLTVADVAERTQASTRTVWRWISTGLPVFRYGQIVRIDPRDLDAFLAAKTTRGLNETSSTSVLPG